MATLMQRGFVHPFMATDDNVDTSRTSVKTYVPAYQKAQWKSHANELGMSQSEFVRAMVQAGRRGFGESDEDADSSSPTGPSAQERNKENMLRQAGGSGELSERVVALLEREGTLSWEALVEALTDDIEERLDDTMAELQDDSKVRYSGRYGGYTISGDR